MNIYYSTEEKVGNYKCDFVIYSNNMQKKVYIEYFGGSGKTYFKTKKKKMKFYQGSKLPIIDLYPIDLESYFKLRKKIIDKLAIYNFELFEFVKHSIKESEDELFFHYLNQNDDDFNIHYRAMRKAFNAKDSLLPIHVNAMKKIEKPYFALLYFNPSKEKLEFFHIFRPKEREIACNLKLGTIIGCRLSTEESKYYIVDLTYSNKKYLGFNLKPIGNYYNALKLCKKQNILFHNNREFLLKFTPFGDSIPSFLKKG